MSMPNRSSKRSTDLNKLAASIVGNAVNETKEPDTGKDPAAVALGRKGGLKGGKARAAKLTKKRRSEIAKKAAQTRWSKVTKQPDKVTEQPEVQASISSDQKLKKRHIIRPDQED